MAERVLEIERLSKRYGDVLALQDLSFQVRAGELFGYVGSNGAGKTTTMRIAMGVLTADAGEVRWAGVPLTFAARRRIGYMPEERGLYPKMRVQEQLVYLARLHGMAVASARRAAARWLERLGLAARATDEVQALSHSNQQRVQLAAALVFAPDLLILRRALRGARPHRRGRDERCAARAGGGAERLWVEAPLAPAGWAQRLPGARVLRSAGTRTLLEPGCDDQMVLRAALATGPVRAVRRDVPRLSDLCRHVVTETGER